MNRDDFIRRIAAAILVGQRKSGNLGDPARAAAYAGYVADSLPGLFRGERHKIAGTFGVGSGTVQMEGEPR
jgi:hypothetical protein